MKGLTLEQLGIRLIVTMMVLVLFPIRTYAIPPSQNGDPETQAALLFDEATALLDQGQLEAALDKFEQAMILYQAAGNSTRVGFCLLSIGDIKAELGDVAGALDAYESSLSIWQDMGLLSLQWTTLSEIAYLQYDEGDYEKALEAFLQALEVARDMEDPESELSTLQVVAIMRGELGQYWQAMEVYAQALAISAEMSRFEDSQWIFAYMGLLSYDYGEYQLALASFERALAIAEDRADLDAKGWILSYVGTVYADLGKPDEAIEVFQQALTIVEEQDDLSLTSAVLSNMGTIYADLGEYEQALDVFQQTLSIHSITENWAMEGTTLSNIGSVYSSMGQDQQALDYLQRSLAVAIDLHDQQGQAIRLGTIGSIYADLGQYEQALNTLEQALTITHDLDMPAEEGMTLLNMGTVYEDLEQYDRAIDFYLRGIEKIERVQGSVTVEQLRTSLASEWIGYYEAVIHLFWLQGDREAAFEYAERARARTFLNQIGNQQIDFRQDANPELVEQERELRKRIIGLQRSLATEQARPLDQQSVPLLDRLSTDLEQARRDREALVTRLKIASAEYASLIDVSTLSLQDVQKQVLDEQITMVEYFVLYDYSLAWVIDQESAEMVELDISADELQSQVGYLRNLIADRDFEAQVATELYDRLFAPLKTHVHHTNLVIVPHGVLHYLPFAALWDAESERYLIEDYALTYAPSASVLKFILDKRNPDEGRLLALGNPDGSLPYAETETKGIARLYDAAPLFRQEAAESRIYAQAGQVDLLHLAAHGVYDPYNALYSRIELASDGAQDGNLEVHEVFGLDLAGANLVVLSACETALGKQSAGDEVVGLTRAFLYAGAPSVVTTLWRVDDAASGELMVAFYRHLQEGLTNAAALRVAQLEVLAQDKWQTPYYWAAFSLMGDYRGSGRPEAAVNWPPTPTATVPAAQTPTRELQPTPTRVPPTTTPEPSSGVGGLCAAAILPLGLLIGAHVGRRRTRQHPT